MDGQQRRGLDGFGAAMLGSSGAVSLDGQGKVWRGRQQWPVKDRNGKDNEARRGSTGGESRGGASRL